MTDEKNILYKKDYVTAAKTDIRKTFAKFRKEQKQAEKISTIEKTQPTNIVLYKKFKFYQSSITCPCDPLPPLITPTDKNELAPPPPPPG